MDSNSRFLLKSFRKYYKENRPIMPDRFTKREFGFMFFDRQMVQRHMGFPAPDELTRFMIAQVPSHSYYSTAYYRKPSAPTMEEKEWLGADLIFDLDADHLEGADRMSYSEMLDRIRDEMINLADSFLFADLGFSDKTVHITFSGGRGYHAHIPSKDVLTLGTHERRELVDYITCSGLNIDWVFPFQRVATSQMKTAAGSRTNVAKDRLIPPPEAGGWKRRMRVGLMDLVNDVCDLDPKVLKRAYPSISSSGTGTIIKMQEDVRSGRKKLFEKNNMATLDRNTQEMLVKIMEEDVAPSLSAEVDKPVTPDIKRIIRLPGSVHGKTGLRVTPITRDELTGFDPLRDAVPSSYSDDPVRITMKKDYEFNMKGEHFSLSGETEVPEFAAVFLVGRRAADHGYLSEKKDSIF
ncbi:MAG: DNA primase small subunit PriS [Methanomassiliicoccaceae archaeon]|nr:DNA primase small subunit PriS [Methanomassiliicoccaceae archaeon]MCL2145576.1 DNA primase small subunit PriS [Methanomassiliicoccaceae archaeon]